jgi:hypothetical protein
MNASTRSSIVRIRKTIAAIIRGFHSPVLARFRIVSPRPVHYISSTESNEARLQSAFGNRCQFAEESCERTLQHASASRVPS